MQVCPCCKQPLPVALPALAGIRFSIAQTKIVEALTRRGECSIEQLIQVMYGDDPDGGPLTARNVLSVQVSAINKKLDHTDVAIRCYHRSYRFVSRARDWVGFGWRVKLTAAVIPAIRVDKRSYNVIAAQYGVTRNAIYMVKHGRTWKHVP